MRAYACNNAGADESFTDESVEQMLTSLREQFSKQHSRLPTITQLKGASKSGNDAQTHIYTQMDTVLLKRASGARAWIADPLKRNHRQSQ